MTHLRCPAKRPPSLEETLEADAQTRALGLRIERAIQFAAHPEVLDRDYPFLSEEERTALSIVCQRVRDAVRRG
jgi:hypothetical protein